MQQCTDPRQPCLLCLLLERRRAQIWIHRTPSPFLSAKFLPTFYPFGSALIIALEMSICDNFCSAVKDMLISTVFIGVCKAEGLLPHRPETAPPRFGTAASAPLQEALCLSSLRSSSLSSSSQQWVQAASFVHCGDSRYLGVVEPLSSEFPTSRASEFGGCSAAEHPCLFDAAFKFTATQHSGPGRPKAGRHIHNWSYDFQITCSS